ncbi:MAG: T9SS type A sorting domain-containing protein [Calditrichaeota bacterium]|nr:T9SS type A sorting domain-containing protein [Calditrichota bacterium]
MLQRTWPEPYLDAQKVLNGAREAARFRQERLDEDPTWVQRGPTNIGGRITDIVGHPTDDNVHYMASASGGVLKSTDAGANWFPITDDLPTPSIGALAIDPVNPNTLYCGTGEANSAGFSYFGSGLYKTVDGGATWQLSGLADSRFIARVVVHPEAPTNVWAASMGELFITGGQRGIYFSGDAGQTWERRLFVNDSTGASDVVVHPANPDIVYAGMWQRIRGPEDRRAGGRGTGIYKSINRGETWVRLSAGLPPIGDDVGRVGLAISQSNPNVLYACFADHPGYMLGVYKTVDGGENWTRTNDSVLESMYSNFGWYFGNIRVRPDDENVVFVLGVSLNRSSNGGASWTEIGEDVHVDHHALWFDPQQPFRFLLGNDGGCYRTINNGTSFESLNNFPAIQFYAATYDSQEPQRLYGGTQDNGTLRTMSGQPNDFERIYGGDGFYTLVDPNDNDYVYAEYQYGGLGKSSNGGQTFFWATDGIDGNERTNWSTPVVFDPSNSQIMYYGAERLYQSINRAEFWTAISPDLTDGGGSGNLSFGTITTIGVSPANSNVIYAGTDDANLWVTTNGGVTWERRDSSLPERWITRVTPHPSNPNEVCVTISGFRNAEQEAQLFISSDQGAHWTPLGTTLPDVPLNDMEYDPEFPSRMYVASDFGVFWSQDRGQHWSVLGRGLPPVPTLEVVLDDPGRRLIAATYGRSFLTLPLDSLDPNHAPEILALSPEPDESGFVVARATSEFSLSVTANDVDGDALSYLWRKGETVLSSQPSANAVVDSGYQVFRISVSDGELATVDSIEVIGVDTIDAVDSRPSLVEEFTISAYPNPFNGEVRIAYSIQSNTDVRISIYSLTGQEVARLQDGRASAGVHELTWQPTRVATGTYFAELRGDNFAVRTKIIYLK